MLNNNEPLIATCLTLITVIFISSCSFYKSNNVKSNDLSNLSAEKIYKIVLPQDLEGLNNLKEIKRSGLDQQTGFIHCAFGNQVEKILQKFFKDEKEVILLELNSDLIKENLKVEENHPGGDKFPHLYAESITSEMIINKLVFVKANDAWEIKK